MQEEKSKILSQTIGKMFDKSRRNAGITYKLFCYENDISTSTYDRVIKGDTQASLYNLSKFMKALGWNFQKFGEELDKALPKEFWEED